MTGGSRRGTRGKGESGKTGAGEPLDLGMSLSVYGKGPQGRLIEIHDTQAMRATGEAHSGRDPWPTEQ